MLFFIKLEYQQNREEDFCTTYRTLKNKRKKRGLVKHRMRVVKRGSFFWVENTGARNFLETNAPSFYHPQPAFYFISEKTNMSKTIIKVDKYKDFSIFVIFPFEFTNVRSYYYKCSLTQFHKCKKLWKKSKILHSEGNS